MAPKAPPKGAPVAEVVKPSILDTTFPAWSDVPLDKDGPGACLLSSSAWSAFARIHDKAMRTCTERACSRGGREEGLLRRASTRLAVHACMAWAYSVRAPASPLTRNVRCCVCREV